jgi:hypothetical protein
MLLECRKTGHCGDIGQGQPIVQMRLDLAQASGAIPLLFVP